MQACAAWVQSAWPAWANLKGVFIHINRELPQGARRRGGLHASVASSAAPWQFALAEEIPQQMRDHLRRNHGVLIMGLLQRRPQLLAQFGVTGQVENDVDLRAQRHHLHGVLEHRDLAVAEAQRNGRLEVAMRDGDDFHVHVLLLDLLQEMLRKLFPDIAQAQQGDFNNMTHEASPRISSYGQQQQIPSLYCSAHQAHWKHTYPVAACRYSPPPLLRPARVSPRVFMPGGPGDMMRAADPRRRPCQTPARFTRSSRPTPAACWKLRASIASTGRPPATPT